jgi:hypothetical protein
VSVSVPDTFRLTHTTEHRFWATPDYARAALRRLHHFNLVWGMFAHGALLIPIVSCANFLAQSRSIRKQEESLLIGKGVKGVKKPKASATEKEPWLLCMDRFPTP